MTPDDECTSPLYGETPHLEKDDAFSIFLQSEITPPYCDLKGLPTSIGGYLKQYQILYMLFRAFFGPVCPSTILKLHPKVLCHFQAISPAGEDYAGWRGAVT